jgi:hypothetical protein
MLSLLKDSAALAISLLGPDRDEAEAMASEKRSQPSAS